MQNGDVVRRTEYDPYGRWRFVRKNFDLADSGQFDRTTIPQRRHALVRAVHRQKSGKRSSIRRQQQCPVLRIYSFSEQAAPYPHQRCIGISAESFGCGDGAGGRKRSGSRPAAFSIFQCRAISFHARKSNYIDPIANSETVCVPALKDHPLVSVCNRNPFSSPVRGDNTSDMDTMARHGLRSELQNARQLPNRERKRIHRTARHDAYFGETGRKQVDTDELKYASWRAV